MFLKKDLMEKNYAFVDAQNVNLAIKDQWWNLDWKKLRVYLKDKYKVEKAYLFIWYVADNTELYSFLQESWYLLIFKPVLELESWKTKWNVDAELVLQAMIDIKNYNKAVIISWDWDFACLVGYLRRQSKLKRLIVPNQKRYSSFLKTEWQWFIDSLTNLKTKLRYKKYKNKKRCTN